MESDADHFLTVFISAEWQILKTAVELMHMPNCGAYCIAQSERPMEERHVCCLMRLRERLLFPADR